MAKYFANNSMGGSLQAVGASYKSILQMAAASGTTLRRGKIYDVLFGTNGTPADNFIEYDLSQITATGALAATSVTLKATDQADGTAMTLGNANHTGEATTTANSSGLYIGVNQRASYRWVSAPGGELVFPATNLNGYTFRVRSAAYTGTATCAMHVDEQ